MSMIRPASLILAVMMSAAAPGASAVEGKLASQTQFEIPAQPLSASLKQLAHQAGIQILFEERLVRGLNAPAIKAEQSPLQALDVLLSNTGLEYTAQNETVAVRKKSAGNARASVRGRGDRVTLAMVQNPQSEGSVEDASEPEEAQSGESPAAELTVTGSRLRGTQTTSQVITIDREEIERKGLSTTEDIIRSIAQNFSSLNSTSALDNSIYASGSQGNSAANLRGLGPENTLVLVNGRRIAGAAIFDGGTVNLSTIPASAIERVEVMLDGASAVYGSDAVAGVINFILRRDSTFSADSRGRVEESSNGGNGYLLSQTLSFGWEGGRTTAAVSYDSREPTTARGIGYTSQDYTSRGGGDNRTTNFGQPGIITSGTTFMPYGALPAGNDGTNTTPADFSPGNVQPMSFIPKDLNSGAKNFSLYWNADQQIGERTTVFVDTLLSRNDTATRGGGASLYFQSVPASNAFNPFGEPVFVNYAFQNEVDAGILLNQTYYSNQERLNVSVGADVQLGRDWQVNVTGNFSREEGSGHSFGFPRFGSPALVAALADANAATALNLFGNGTAQNPQTLAGLLIREDSFLIDSDTKGLSMAANGTLAQIATGAIMSAVGAEYRREGLDTFGADAYRSVGGAFAEVSLPLMRSLRAEFAGRYEEYGASGDFDSDGTSDGKIVFSKFSPKIGLLWRATDNFRLRASWSKAFRAPTINDLYGTVQDYNGFWAFEDPLAPAGTNSTVNPLVRSQPNPGIGPETSTSWSAGVEWRGSDAAAGLRASLNYNKIEYADRIVSGFVTVLNNRDVVLANPDLFPGIAIRDNVNSAGVDGLAADNPAIVDGTLVALLTSTMNLAARDSESLDFSLGYLLPLASYGTLDFGVNAVHTLKLSDQLVAATAPMELVATYQGPDKWRWIFNAAWDYGNLNTNVYLNHTSSYQHDSNFGAGPAMPVDGYTTVDLTVNYRFATSTGWLRGTKMSLGARNLFDAEFPFIDATRGPFDPSRVDLRGRIAFVDFTHSF